MGKDASRADYSGKLIFADLIIITSPMKTRNGLLDPFYDYFRD